MRARPGNLNFLRLAGAVRILTQLFVFSARRLLVHAGRAARQDRLHLLDVGQVRGLLLQVRLVHRHEFMWLLGARHWDRLDYFFAANGAGSNSFHGRGVALVLLAAHEAGGAVIGAFMLLG